MNDYSMREFTVGQSAEKTHTVTEGDIYAFAWVTGDLNPMHVDASYAANGIFGERVAHGMFTGGFISAVLGTQLPGPGSVYLSQELKFRAPVRIGDTIRAVVTVTAFDAVKNRVTLRTECINQDGMIVVEGTAVMKVNM